VSVISFATNQVIDTWHVGASPDMMQVSVDGTQLWASNRYDASVSVIDTRTGRLLHAIAVGKAPHGSTLFPQPGSLLPRAQRRIPLREPVPTGERSTP
jgi:YVTN family beta-propeller protein